MRGHHGADLVRLVRQRRPDPQVADDRGELLGELLGDVLVDVEAVGGGAGLATASELGLNGTRHCGVDIGVGRHDEGSVPPELHG